MKKLLLIITSLVLLLAACSGASSNTAPANIGAGVRAVLKSQPIQSVDKDFVNGVNAFGLKSASLLYNSNKNLAISPVSLELALAMSRTGAEGATADEISSALCLDGISEEDIVSACRSLMWRANTGGMESVNSIWLLDGFPYKKSFIDVCTGDFMADAFPLVIPGAMDDINAWANEKTHGRVNDIIQQELDPRTVLVLCNALYFLGDWETPFESSDTHDEEFNAPGGNITAAFMHSSRDALYYTGEKFSMLSLPFKSGEGEGKYAMAFLLPDEGSDVTAMLASLDAGTFSEALSGLNEQPVLIKLPKFEYSFFTSFKDTLISLGMDKAFKVDMADFSNMSQEDGIYIDEVLHKCYIRVDELGAEAAAVTAVINRAGGMSPEDTAEFYADRPFVFAIYSQEDGAIAFMGAVNDPTQKD